VDIKLTEEQSQLKDMAAKFMDNNCTFDFVRGIENDSDTGFCRDMWGQFADMGWLGVLVPEEYDGMGMSVLDMVILVRELGRHICPSPYLHTAVLAADLIANAGSEEQKKALLPQIVSGEKVYALAYQEFSRFFRPEHIKLDASANGDGYTLNGSKLFVEFADGADALLVAARSGAQSSSDGLTLFLVDRSSAGLSTRHMPTMARDRHYQVDFDNVEVPSTAIIGEIDKGWDALEPALHKMVIGFCAFTNGAGFEMHEHSTQYARERVQFGRPIGQMQTIQGYLAQLIMELYGADMLTMFTAFQKRHQINPEHPALVCQRFEVFIVIVSWVLVQSVATTVGDGHWLFAVLHGLLHSGFGGVRQIDQHTFSVHLFNALKAQISDAAGILDQTAIGKITAAVVTHLHDAHPQVAEHRHLCGIAFEHLGGLKTHDQTQLLVFFGIQQVCHCADHRHLAGVATGKIETGRHILHGLFEIRTRVGHGFIDGGDA